MSYKPERHWVNKTQPQTLQIGVILLYINAAFLVIFGGLSGGIGLIGLAFAAAQVGGGYGIANERRWGYWLGVAVSGLVLLFTLYLSVITRGGEILNLVFAIALVALLLHPQSRDYRRVWFK